MAMWNPWRGCKKCSDGCLHCYIHKGDVKRDVNINDIVKTKDFYKPIEKLKNGNYKMVYLCFSIGFLIEEADAWRGELCVKKDVHFEFRQCGTHFIKDGKQYKLQIKDLCKQAKLTDIDY